MPLDFSLLNAPQVDMLGNYQRGQQFSQQNAQNQMQQMELARGMQRKNKLSDLLNSSGGDLQSLIEPLARGGYLTEAAAVQSMIPKQEAYTLGEGQVRYGANNQPLAQGLPKPEKQESTLAKIDPKDYTPQSVKMWFQGGMKDPSLLLAKAQKTEAITPVQSMQAEMSLTKEHAAQSKDFIAGRDAYSQLKSTLTNANKSPAQTLAAATKFMKMIDPGSVVRESELGMALQATGVYDRMGNYLNMLQIGKNLTPDQIKDFENASKLIYEASAQGQNLLDRQYTEQAIGWGLDPKRVVRDYYFKEPKQPVGASRVGASGGWGDTDKESRYQAWKAQQGAR